MPPLPRGRLGWLAAALVLTAPPITAADPVTLERVVPRHDPALDLIHARLAVGRDGNVYLANGGRDTGYVLRVSPDGKDRLGGRVGYSLTAVAADPHGLVATAEAHFPHRVAFWSPAFAPLGKVSDFLASDQVQWNAPSDVQAGESGDFYAVDQHRLRVVHVRPPDRIVAVYPLDRLGEASRGGMVGLRVWEKGQRLVTAWPDGTIHASGFDGKPLWSVKVKPAGESLGGFDLDVAGDLYVLSAPQDEVRVYDAEGKPTGVVKLKVSGRPPGVTDLRVRGPELFVKRADPLVLFEVYDRATGELRRRVPADAEVLRVRYPSAVWTAGRPVPLAVAFDPGPRPVKPSFRVWLRPLGVPEFTELLLADGAVTPPADAGGLYQVRITPDVRGRTDEYAVDGLVEIRAPGAAGSVSILTPLNRFYYGQGEDIPVSVIARAAAGTTPPARLTVVLRNAAGPHHEQAVTLTGGRAEFTIPGKQTGFLATGRYELTADVPGFTVARQYLKIGSGLRTRPRFHLVQHGDYGSGFPTPPRPAGSALPPDLPDAVADHLARTRALGINLFADRLGHPSSGLGELSAVAQDQALVARLKADPAAVAPEKAAFESAVRRTVAGYGASGVEEQGILLYMDAGVPLGTGHDKRTPAQMEKDLQTASKYLLPYPAFRGWSWAANWWPDKLGADAAKDAAEKSAYAAALKRARETGAWSPVLDAVSDRVYGNYVEANRRLGAALHAVAPGKLTAATGPYRSPPANPPVVFRDVDEVDLHYQAEQIQPPQVTPHNADFYKRPGKPAWGHPELWNDDGTGGMALPTLFQMAMRGADGVGRSGPVGPGWGHPDPDRGDPRAGGPGTTSVFRAAYDVLRMYGPWLTALENADQVAIVVSTRMQRIETFDGKIGGAYFDSLFEAYNACLYAHRPASFVFTEDLAPDTLKRFQVVLVVAQRVGFDPPLAEALKAAQATGVKVFHDGSCRAELVRGFTPLGVAFDRVRQDPSAWQDDAAYDRFPRYFKAHAEVLRKVLGPVVPPVAGCGNPEVMLTERRSGAGRFVWAVNNTMLGWDPGLAWRVSLLITHRVPVVETLKLAPSGSAVYDVLAGKRVEPGAVTADLRTAPARLYAVLPQPIEGVEPDVGQGAAPGRMIDWRVRVVGPGKAPIDAALPVRVRLRSGRAGEVLAELFTAARGAEGVRGTFPWPTGEPGIRLEVADLTAGTRKEVSLGTAAQPPAEPAEPPVEERFGPHVRDVAVSPDGRAALLNCFNWDHNLYAIDPETGEVRWRNKVGHFFAFDPTPLQDGFAVQGFDVTTAEGYHLYRLDDRGRADRRFALFGLPKRATSWAAAEQIQDAGINNFAVAPGGGWVASAGDLGLIVWDRTGQRLWSEDWWKTIRKRVRLVALNDQTLVTLDGTTATARDARDGKPVWSLKLADTGSLRGAAMSADRKTLAVRSDALGGQVFVIRDGKLINALTTAAEEFAVSPDGSLVAAVEGRLLKMYDAAGGLLWTYTGDDTLRRPRVSPDGRRIAVGSELGTLAVLTREGAVAFERDLGALSVPAWLPGGDLLAATWAGAVTRFDPAGHPRWRRRLTPAEADARSKLLAKDPTPTTRATGWGNASAQPMRLTPNLLAETKAKLEAVHDPAAHGDPLPWQNKVEMLTDGKPDAPPRPWLEWPDVGRVDRGGLDQLVLRADTFRTLLRVTAVTFVEDPRHPESWLRDVRLQWWDAAAEVWRDGPYLLSDSTVHTHKLDRPIEAAKFRFVTTGGGSWPVGNFRLGELVFHGRALGASHPDAAAKKPLAVLFDEDESDLRSLLYPGKPFAFRYSGAHSGGKCLELTAAGTALPALVPPFGHAVPNWDFEIAERPKPGQYRYLQFAWKAASEKTTGISLLVGRNWPAGGVAVTVGDAKWTQGATTEERVPGPPPTEWRTVRVDLWKLTKGKPPRIQSLGLLATGGGAQFDQIVLGRSLSDLPSMK